MLSLRDCLDYSDLTDEEVEIIAEHEDVPDAVAAQWACALVQTPEGAAIIHRWLQDSIERALSAGHPDRANEIRRVLGTFDACHPCPR